MRTRRVVQAVLYAAALFGWHKLLSSTFSVHTKPVHTLPSVTLAREHSGLRPRSETVLRELEQMYLRNEPSHAPIPHPQRPSRGQRRSLALSVDWNATCASVREHTDLEGAVVRDGYGPRGLSLLPDACCTACAQTRGCNVWVACADSSKCGQQCWLKWAEDPATTSIRGSGSFVPWTSGIMAGKDTPGSVIVPPEADLAAVDVVALRTKYGDLRIRLRPDWHEPSVRYVRTVALTDTCTAKCVLYRAEPGFLLQGGMRAVVPPNNETKEKAAGTAMEKGDVAWAGGSAGPDLFITMSRVGGFGGSHTVWGQLADEESFALSEKLVQLPIEKGLKPGSMRMIADPVPFTVHPAQAS